MSLNNPTPEEISLARQLADPTKSIRDKAVKSLGSFVSSSVELNDLDMLKFWKGLYYCLWLSDKAPIQMELATALSNLVHSCSSENKTFQFITMFFRTILREWAYLDQYRVNKFYSLLRFMLRQSFSYLHQRQWHVKSTNLFLEILKNEVFCKTPNGPRLHYADIYLPELLVVTKGKILTGNLIILLRPFLDALSIGNTADAAFKDRIGEKVLGDFAEQYSAEHDSASSNGNGSGSKASNGASSTQGGEEERAVFSQVRTGAIQHEIFSTASDEKTLEGNRKRLYDIHKVFQKATGVDFADEDPSDLVVEKGTTGKAQKKEVAIAAFEPAGEEEKAGAKSKKDKKKKGEIEPGSAPDSKKAKVSNKSGEAVPAQAPQAAAQEKGEKDKKRKPNTIDQPPQPILKKSKAVSDATTDAAATDEDFLAAKKFDGKMAGFVFKNGAKGIGYYKDTHGSSKNQQKKGASKEEPTKGKGRVSFSPATTKKK